MFLALDHLFTCSFHCWYLYCAGATPTRWQPEDCRIHCGDGEEQIVVSCSFHYVVYAMRGHHVADEDCHVAGRFSGMREILKSHHPLLHAMHRWNEYMDAFVATGNYLKLNGFAQSNVQHFLKYKEAQKIIIPLLVCSVFGPSRPLQQVIELDCKGKLSHDLGGPYQLTIQEIKSSTTGEKGLANSSSFV